MIRIRLSAFNKDNALADYNIVQGERLSEAVKRIMDEKPEIEKDPKDILIASVNGMVIPPDIWDITLLKREDVVLLSPNLKSGDGNSLLRTALIVAAAFVAAPALVGYLGIAAGTIGAGLVAAGVATIASYAAFQLFPPPVIGTDASLGTSFGGSQMYTISSQSNALRKFGSVPKVYGTHRMFPVLVANPYVELKAEDSGEVVQYFHAIYDFGLGPVSVKDVRIGNTPIENFTDVTYRLVDPNRPAISEGPWDDATSNTFEIYKGDISTENVGLALNGNRESGAPVEEYQIIRNGGSNPGLDPQEIVLDFVNPQGLIAFTPTGSTSPRYILLEIYYSKVNEDNWIPFNDLNFVSEFEATGGQESRLAKKSTTIFEVPSVGSTISDFTINGYSEIGTTPAYALERKFFDVADRSRQRLIGYPAGATFIPVPASAPFEFIVGSELTFDGRKLGKVISTSSPSPGVLNLNLERPLAFPIVAYSVTDTQRYFLAGGAISYTVLTLNSVIPFTSDRLIRKPNSIGRFEIGARSQDPFYSSVRFTPIIPAQYKVRINRVGTSSTGTLNQRDVLAISSISTRTDASPIQTTKRHTFMELRIKATGQINGNIQNLSAVCTSVLDTWNGSQWVKAETNNPAWVFVDILTGEINKRPLDKARLDIGSLYEWAQYCDEIPVGGPTVTYTAKRYATNFILDFDTTVQRVIQQVANSAQASLNLIDGKYGVLLDILRTVPVQIFTPRNSREFSSSRGYAPQPPALKVTYIDPNAEWQPAEVIVYDNGFNAVTALDFDSITTFAVTDVEQAYRFGRYFLAQNRLRKESITLKVDFEYLVCTRGDYVQITQDSMKVGGTPCRVKSITGNRVIVDEGLETSGLINYGYVYRAVTGEIRTNTLTVVSADTFDLDGIDLPQRGDLIIIGEVGKVVYDCLVKSIIPENDLTATLLLIEKADAIYGIDQIDVFPDYDPSLSVTVNPDFTPPGEVQNLQVIDNSYRILNNGYEYFINIDWDAPTGSAYELFEVHVDTGAGYFLQDSIEESDYSYIVDETKLGIEHKFKVLAVSSTGKKLTLGEVGFVSATPIKKMTPPSDVIPFNSDITGETLQLFWTKVIDADIREYIIRYSPSVDGTWETSTILQRVSSNTNLVMTQARTGVYLIKAVDFAGNESSTASVIITTIPKLTGLNIIEELNDFPILNGIKDQVEKLGGTLVLQQSVVGLPGSEQYYPEGFYYYEGLLDLGEIYTVRLQSLIQAEGLVSTDIMANWITLSSVLSLYSPGSADWDVEAQYRSTDSLNVMADWVTLDSIASLSEGNADKFTPWRKFIIGDATGRIFQFRLRLISNVPAVTPRVLNGIIRADMPDRREPYNNLVAPNTGLYVPYTPAFAGPGLTPNVQITLENGQSGDYWIFTAKTLQGFTIVFYDKNNNAVSRQFDAQVQGYGRRAMASI